MSFLKSLEEALTLRRSLLERLSHRFGERRAMTVFATAETLVGLGYTNVSDLEGGMEAWQRAGFELNGV